VITVCSLILNGPVLNVHRMPKVLKTRVGTNLAQKQPMGYINLQNKSAMTIQRKAISAIDLQLNHYSREGNSRTPVFIEINTLHAIPVG
jgi:hypothetical protein